MNDKINREVINMLIKCPECELQVSDKAEFCPHCGYPINSKSQRKKPSKNGRRRRLPNGFGQISEIKNRNLRNPFRVMVTVGKNPDGKPICKPLKPCSYFQTYNEAYSALVEYNRNPYDLSPSITVKELYDKWIEVRSKEQKSKSNERGIRNAWLYCSSVYNMRVVDLRPRHIKGCMEEGTAVIRGKTQTPNVYIQNIIKTLFNQMLDYAVEYEIVDRNCARNFHLSDDIRKEIVSVKKSHIVFSEEEISKLWLHVDDKQYADMILIQCYSGWRPQELILIELKDVDIENWRFTGGVKTEAGKNRTVPIHSKIRQLVLNRYNAAKKLGCQFLFNQTDQNGKYANLSYNRYYNGFCMLRDELKLGKEHRPHDGRVHFITIAKKSGMDEYAIKYIVGHNIADITEKVYTKREYDWLSNEIEKIK